MGAPNPTVRPRSRARVGMVALGALLGCLVVYDRPAVGQLERGGFVPQFEENARTKGQLVKLEALQAQKLWDEWIQTYQALVDDHPEGVIKKDDEFYTGLRYHLHSLLSKLPLAVKQKYRAKFDVEARQLYDKALASGDGGQMRQVYSRYRHSSYGNRALAWIANQALDTGNAETARIAFGRVVADGGASAGTFFKYALAAQTAGQVAEAKQALERAAREMPNAAVRLAGEQMTVASAAQKMLGTLAAAPTPDRDWPDFTGPSGDRLMPDVKPGITARPWRKTWEYTYPQPTRSVTMERRQTIIMGQGYQPRTRYGFISYPIVSGDTVYVQGVKSVAALALNSGSVLWTNEDFSTATSAGTGGGARRNLFRGQFSRSARGQSQAAPVTDGGLIAIRIGLLATANPYTAGTPGDYLMSVLDARTGRQLWRKTADGEQDGVYFNLPALQDNTLFTGVMTGLAGITEFRAYALEAGTGEVVWSTYLGGGSDNLFGVDGGAPVIRDGVVWLESSMHTLNGLDIITGEIRTIYRYSPRPSRSAAMAMAEFSLPNEPISLIPRRGPLVFSSRWGDQVVAIDPQKGTLLWSAPKGQATAVCAVDKQTAYLAGGQEIAAFDLETGAKRWQWSSPGSLYATGSAAMIGGRLAVISEGKLYSIDPATGQTSGEIDLGEPLNDAKNFTSLLAVRNRLLVSMNDRLMALEPVQ